LEADGILDNSYVILTSDHGELFERGIRGHVTMTLFEGLLHVPLLISKPGQQNREDVFAHTSSVDVLPTLLHLTGQPIADWCEGQVLPSFGVDVVENGRSIYGMEAKSNPKQAPLTKATLALVKDQFKLIHYFGYRPDDPEGTYELFDLENDPEELENLINSGHPAEAALKAEMAEKLAEVNRPFQR
ncbi:MAG: sulfatase-like hydrolase/transferase, partial [Anaerolineales bacterium]|nr:sulfatase-like hydrolase/transferase [Anaerolineales bacterium]